MAHVLIKLPELPTLLNKLYMPVTDKATGKARIIKTPAGKESTKLIQMVALSQRANKRLQGDLSLKIDLCLKKGRREPDADAVLKLLMDSLEGIAYDNDKQIIFLQLGKHRDQERDEVIILVEQI